MSQDLGRDVPDLEEIFNAKKLGADSSFTKIDAKPTLN